jgi:hypothetical protein
VDVTYVLDGITFTWDDAKARANLRKHGVTFETAAEVFFDPFIRVVGDSDKNGEVRQTAIGLTRGWQLLRVTYVLRAVDIRLVSARKPTRSERKLYETDKTA